MPTEAEVAWFAGLYEGDGTIKSVGQYSVCLVIAVQDEEVIRKVASLWPEYGNVGTWTQNPNSTRVPYKSMWAYNVAKREELIDIIIQMWSWLSSRRRAQVVEVFDKTIAVRSGRKSNPFKALL